MRLVMVGTGYVGLVSGTCFAEFGIDVVCVDKDPAKIMSLKKGIMPIYEPGLKSLVGKQVAAHRLSFTTDLDEALKGADVVFIAVGTPARAEDGHADLTYIHQAAKEVAERVEGYTVLVTKSTVPVGTARAVEAIVMQCKKSGSQIDVCSNPEFLREGSAIKDFMFPDRIVIGAETERSIAVLKNIYRPLKRNDVPLMVTNPETAETIKYAANAFLATKITFINQIADLCEATGANVEHVAKAMGQDERIAPQFLQASPGYGGSCFPKDTLALAQTGQKVKAPQTVVEAVVKANDNRQKQMAQKIIAACGGSVEGLTIGILGVAFKPNTDDVRAAPSLTILPILQKAGAKIIAHDPQAMAEAAKILLDVEWKDDPYAVSKGAHAVVLMTAWNEFRGLSMTRMAKNMKVTRMIDLHNIYKQRVMKDNGFHYISVGRAEIHQDNVETLRKAS
ncbi:MAG: UDP-glucose/GDP-mannose dehydrogenase family protein [Pseudomonadota bacterium]